MHPLPSSSFTRETSWPRPAPLRACATLLRTVPTSRPPPTEPAAGADHAGWHAAAASVWPPHWVDEPAFVAHVVAVGATDRARAADLYLALACARGVREALGAFEQRHFADVARIASRRRVPVATDEAHQLVRDHLFVGTAARPPRVAQYDGRGSLEGWFRTATLRLLLNAAARAPRDRPTEDEALEALTTATRDPELAFLKDRYAAAVNEALREAWGALEGRDRRLLSARLAERKGVGQIAAAHGVHRVTVQKWLAAAKEALSRGLRRAVSARLGLGPTEVESVLRWLQSRIDLEPTAGQTPAREDDAQ